MGSKSSSSSNQATHNNSTSLAAQGDNNGFMTSGSNNNFNITQTDHGLVDGLTGVFADLAGSQTEQVRVAGDMTQGAFDLARDVNGDSLNFASDVNKDSLTAMGWAVDGAFGFGRDALDFGGDALAMTGNLAQDSIKAQNYLAETTIKENSDLAREIAISAENMHGNNTAFANNAILTVSDSLSDANKGMADLAYYTSDNASNLARDFAIGSAEVSQAALESTQKAYDDAASQSLSAHTQALQFADNAMRSDGQQLAISTNETMKYIVLGLGGVAILAVVFMGRK